MQPSGANQQELTFDSASDTDPAWSSGRGAQLAYTRSLFTGEQSIYVISRAGGTPRQLTSGPSDKFPAWSPDGREILFTRAGALYEVPPAGETVAGGASFVVSVGVDAVWAPVVPPVATRATGLVTVTAPGAATVTISTPSGTVPNPTGAPGAPVGLTLTTGTLVNAAAGTVNVAFRARDQAPSATPSTAVVHGLAVTVGATTATTQTLQLNLPACGRKAAVAAASHGKGNSGRVRVKGNRFRAKSHQIVAGGGEPTYTVVVTCTGTRVTVTSGHVPVRFLQRRHKPQTLHAGQSLFVPAGPGR
jgi:dipeptidyl aminopeptidase/acylaminoacyl peptidase